MWRVSGIIIVVIFRYSFGLLLWEPPQHSNVEFFMTAICSHVASNSDKYKASALTNIALALGRLQHRDVACLEVGFSSSSSSSESVSGDLCGARL